MEREEMETKAPLYEYNRVLNNRNISDEIGEILVSDITNVVEGTKHNGIFIVIITMLLVFPLTLLKLLHCTWTFIFDSKDGTGIPLNNIFKEHMETPIGMSFFTEDDIGNAYEEIEKFDNDLPVHPNIKNKRKANQVVEALQNMRDILILNNSVLETEIIKTVQHKIPDEILEQDAIKGIMSRPYLTQYLDFGESINKYLQLIFSETIKLKKIKEIPYPCVTIHDDKIFDLINDLKDTFLDDNIRITFKNKGD